MDVRLPPTFTDDGLRAALEARAQVPGLPVLVLSQYVEQLYARELLADQGGGVGYLLKDRVFNDDQFVDAVRDGRGRRHGHGHRGGGQAAGPPGPGGAARPGCRPASGRCSELMAEGRSNSAIAQRLFVTREGGQQAQHQHLRQARPGALRRRQPPGAGRAGLPERLTGAGCREQARQSALITARGLGRRVRLRDAADRRASRAGSARGQGRVAAAEADQRRAGPGRRTGPPGPRRSAAGGHRPGRAG